MDLEEQKTTGKHPGGRPTKYDPKYCDEIIEFMREGKHLVQFAAKIGINKDSLQEWTKKHEEFSVALKIAKDASTAWWLDRYTEKAIGLTEKGSDVLLIKMLKVKDPEFHDKPNVIIHQPNANNNVDFSQLSTETRMALIKEIERKEAEEKQ